MKKIVCFLLVLILVFSSFGNSFIFPAKIARAEALSTNIFPSTISGMQLTGTAMQAPSGCYVGIGGFVAVPEFAIAAYQSASGQAAMIVNVGKYNTSGSAENTAKNCMAQLKADVGTYGSWGGTRNTTVSGYKAIYDVGVEPGYANTGIIFVIVNEYLISLTILSGSSISLSDLAGAGAAMVSRVLQISPPSGKNDGEYCNILNSSECKSGYCFNSVCCVNGKECCTENRQCREGFSCDTSVYYCVEKKLKGSSCQLDSECQTNYCGYAGSNKICCTKGPMGICCKTQSDCGASEYCSDYGCKARESDGSQCGYDYECKSDYCEGGKCKTRYQEKAKFNLGRFCKRSSECESKNCSNGICCEKDKHCCSLTQECEKDKGEWWQCVAGYCKEDVEGKEIYDREKKRKDGYCAPDEKCYTPDCEYTVRCGINEACAFGGENERAAVGCIASIVSELNIVAKAIDVIQGIGCDVLGNLISGLLSTGQEAVDKVYSAFVSIIYVAIDIGLELSKVVALILKVIACIDGYFGISKTILIQLAYSLTEVVSAVSGNQTAMVALESPAGLIVTDNKGNETGISAQGITHNEIPNSIFIEFPKSDLKLVFLADTGGDYYRVSTIATAAGTINVKTARSDGETIEKMTFDNIAQDSTTKTDLFFQTEIGWSAETMHIPQRGGGIIDKTGQLSSEKISETKIPDKFRIKESSTLKILKILLIVVVLILGIGFAYKKKDFILKFFKRRKEAGEGRVKKLSKLIKILIIVGIIVAVGFILYSVLFGISIFKKGGSSSGGSPPASSAPPASSPSTSPSARDLVRLTDISNIRVAAELHRAERGYYPYHMEPIAIGGKCLSASGFHDDCTGSLPAYIYIAKVPSNPSPRTDGNCPDRDYIYQASEHAESYTIKYCLGTATGGISAGEHQATPNGIADP